jgi:hypothetical protein
VILDIAMPHSIVGRRRPDQAHATCDKAVGVLLYLVYCETEADLPAKHRPRHHRLGTIELIFSVAPSAKRYDLNPARNCALGCRL